VACHEVGQPLRRQPCRRGGRADAQLQRVGRQREQHGHALNEAARGGGLEAEAARDRGHVGGDVARRDGPQHRLAPHHGDRLGVAHAERR
jgi:hypothetical protein